MRDERLYVIFLNAVRGKPFTPAAIHAHVNHLRTLDQAGKLVLCGPLKDAEMGLVIIRAADTAEAETVARTDPFVVQGFRTFTVRTLEVASAENNYLAR